MLITHLLLVLVLAQHKSAYNSLIIGPRGWNENQPIENHELVGFHLGPLLQGRMRIAKLKSAYNSLIIGPRGLEWKTNL